MKQIFRHYLISGRVQGVGYRAFAHRTASMLGLRGWVRNLDDGRVEALAQGSNDQFLRWETELRQGPSRALVEQLKSRIVDGSFVWENFVIAPDGAAEWSQES